MLNNYRETTDPNRKANSIILFKRFFEYTKAFCVE